MRLPTAVVLTKAARAHTTLPRSLDALRSAGIEPRLIISTYQGPNTDAEVRAQAHRALMAAAHDPLGLLFFEDDIAVDGPLLRRHVVMAVEAGRITAFCLVAKSHYPPQLLDDIRPVKAHLFPMPNPQAPRTGGGGFHGSMAVYLPPEIVAYGAAHPHEFTEGDGRHLEQPMIPADHQHGRITGFDLWIKHQASQHGGILGAMPNSVDHLGDGPGERWRSPTYGRPWLPA